MNSVNNFIIGMMDSSNPNWFDWLSLIVSVIAILFAYWSGEKTYKRDRADKVKEQDELDKSEISLFKNNLYQLNEAIKKQIPDIKEYIEAKDLRIGIYPALNVNFLSFVDLKSLYRKNTDKTMTINRLLSSLYGLTYFKNTLTDELRKFEEKHRLYETIFKDNYNEVFINKVYEINNKRAINFVVDDNKIKKWQYNDGDNFIREYMTLTNSFKKIVANENGVVDRQKVFDELLKMIEVTKKYIPEDYDAIIIHNISEKARSAYLDMEQIKKDHHETLKSYSKLLEKAEGKISDFMQLI